MRTNLGLKIFALITAFLIWLQMALISDHYSVVKFKLDVVNKPQTLTLEQEFDRLPFRVHGKGLDIIKLMFSDTRVQIDASELTAGMENLALRDYQILNRPDNLAVEFIGPAVSSDLAISTDVLTQKIVRLLPNFADENSRRFFEDKRFYLTPDRITISGPRSRVQSLESVRTQRLTVSMLKSNDFELGLQLPSKDISANINQVRVSVATTLMMTRILQKVRIDADPGISYIPSTVTLKVEGTPAGLDNLGADELKVKAVASASEEGMYELEVELPEDVTLLALTPKKVRLRR